MNTAELKTAVEVDELQPFADAASRGLETVLNLLNNLEAQRAQTDEATPDEAWAAIERGERAVANGQVMPYEDVRKRYEKWLTA